MNPLRGLVLGLIGLYQRVASPTFGGACRFEPSCSHYAAAAVRKHGVVGGLWLALKRVLRCHPLGTHGYDPVP